MFYDDKIAKRRKLLLYFKWKARKMCKKLNELNGKEPSDLLQLLGDDATKLPIDIKKIFEKLSISYSGFDFSSLETDLPKGEKILGAALVDDDDVVILYRNGESKNRERFTLAHELAHCCLDAQNLKDGHIEYRSDRISNDETEIKANIFAGELLIPEDSLMQEYNKIIAPLSDVLAKIFGVSTNVMEKRLDYLKLPYYTPVVPKD